MKGDSPKTFPERHNLFPGRRGSSHLSRAIKRNIGRRIILTSDTIPQILHEGAFAGLPDPVQKDNRTYPQSL
jgi:hypothetical protein